MIQIAFDLVFRNDKAKRSRARIGAAIDPQGKHHEDAAARTLKIRASRFRDAVKRFGGHVVGDIQIDRGIIIEVRSIAGGSVDFVNGAVHKKVLPGKGGIIGELLKGFQQFDIVHRSAVHRAWPVIGAGGDLRSDPFETLILFFQDIGGALQCILRVPCFQRDDPPCGEAQNTVNQEAGKQK